METVASPLLLLPSMRRRGGGLSRSSRNCGSVSTRAVKSDTVERAREEGVTEVEDRCGNSGGCVPDSGRIMLGLTPVVEAWRDTGVSNAPQNFDIKKKKESSL